METTFIGRIGLDIFWRLEISPGLDLEGKVGSLVVKNIYVPATLVSKYYRESEGRKRG